LTVKGCTLASESNVREKRLEPAKKFRFDVFLVEAMRVVDLYSGDSLLNIVSAEFTAAPVRRFVEERAADGDRP
jgi:hypothetical protein